MFRSTGVKIGQMDTDVMSMTYGVVEKRQSVKIILYVQSCLDQCKKNELIPRYPYEVALLCAV